MRRSSLLIAVAGLVGCNAQEDPPSSEPVEVTLSAAFTDLSYIDVYGSNGTFLKTVGADTDFRDALPMGTYLMDFVSGSGQHSFLPDGRMAFAPMAQGATPVGGPVELFEGEPPLWEVAVDPVLEANARLARRLRDRDASLEPWRRLLEPETHVVPEPGGPAAVPMDFEDFDTHYDGTWKRLRVTWEASFAVTGRFTLAPDDPVTCNGSPDCWTGRGDSFAHWSADEDDVGYVDFDTATWETMVNLYGDNATCLPETEDDGCHVTVDVSDARNYTCQSEDGTCIDGTGEDATRPRGGQCKFFQNLVLYRSGIYPHLLPRDKVIRGYSPSRPADHAARSPSV